MKKVIRKALLLFACVLLALPKVPYAKADDEEKPEKVTLRICNWEEYIDEGDWDEDEAIELESGTVFGENDMISDFEDWYYETYGIEVEVEYSNFGTCEDLYNMLTIGDVYDLCCPSEYLVMKLMAEDKLVPLSDHFFDTSDENNYYVKGVSPYIQNILETKEINGEAWGKYMAGFMWGVTGIVYNPEVVTEEEASTWTIINNTKFNRQITIKDNVRDSYFAAVGAIKSDLLLSDSFKNDPDYAQKLEDEMNDTSPEMVAEVQDYLQQVRDNVYSFETDSGKADMITGKVVANYQWSGDAVYTMDQADEDDYTLNFAIPQESTDIYFDGWVMLKCGIGNDSAKQHAAEAFINFVSRPDNAVRNMYYIGYTSVISGGTEDNTVFEYLKWNYEAEDDCEDTVEYDVSYFFLGEGAEGEYVFTVPEEQTRRQLGAQYPSAESLSRSCIMVYFDTEVSESTNKMWSSIRCYNIKRIPVWAWITGGVITVGILGFLIRTKLKKRRTGR